MKRERIHLSLCLEDVLDHGWQTTSYLSCGSASCMASASVECGTDHHVLDMVGCVVLSNTSINSGYRYYHRCDILSSVLISS